MELPPKANYVNDVLPPLLFSKDYLNSTESNLIKVNCLKCNISFNFPETKDDYLGHLFLAHRLVIADVEDIPLLEDYLNYWHNKFQQCSLEEYCTTMLLDQLPDGSPSKNEKYYLLSDIVPEDYELRRKLKDKQLIRVLNQHQYELNDHTFTKECLYCRAVITGLRSSYLQHLFTKHFLQLGKPENLVFIDDLLLKVKHNMDNLICLYCEKVFKDRPTLKEHMRKKAHKRINPNLREYDKYFLENYQLPERKAKFKNQSRQKRQVQRTNHKMYNTKDTSSQDLEQRFAIHNSDSSDPEWEEWSDEISQPIICLFCSVRSQEFSDFKQHLLDEHDVNFQKCVENLNFYQRIKMVNYVRRQNCFHRCVTCNKRCHSSEALLQHLQHEKHYGVGDRSQWDKPEYFFPTYEDDGLLCLLDDNPNDDDNIDDTVVKIISEESIVQINKEAEHLSLENFQLL